MAVKQTEYYIKNENGGYDPVHFLTDANIVNVADAGGYYTESNAEGVLQEIGSTSAKNEKSNGLRFDKITTPKNRSGTILTFVDDDGRSEVLTLWKPITDAKAVNITMCQTVNSIGTEGYLTLTQLHTLEDAGYDVLSHTLTHPLLSQLTESQLEAEFSGSQDYFRSNGFKNTNVLVYPTGLSEVTQLVKDTARKYYEYCIDAGGGLAATPVDSICVNRVPYESNLDTMKEYLNAAAANGDWMIVMTHCWGWAEADVQIISGLIDYAVSIGTPIMKFSDAAEYKGNVIGTGEYTGLQRFYVSRDGRVKCSNYVTSQYGASASFSKAITAFQTNAVTVECIPNSEALNAPVPGIGGVLATYRLMEDGYSYQIYIPVDGSSMKRRQNDGANWATWVDDGSLRSQFSSSCLTKLITEYPADKISYELVSTADAANAPVAGTAGILITYRFIDDGYSYQEYKVYNAKARYTRSWGGSWGSWEQSD